ncbi:hypothetical protein QOZ80_3AG0236620 [Eleusine coracana subsp. coracana]|nr:hypothetical protein QOZ80_3AG0236620 [Eleusine coracana subsp. coracana]
MHRPDCRHCFLEEKPNESSHRSVSTPSTAQHAAAAPAVVGRAHRGDPAPPPAGPSGEIGPRRRRLQALAPSRLSDAGFRRRFRERHRTPPILGFFLWDLDDDDDVASFAPAPSSPLRHVAIRHARPCDARLGRVLLHAYPHRGDDSDGCRSIRLIVWDPITREKLKLPTPPRIRGVQSWNAAVLCAGGGACDHLDCRGGPFLVVLVVTGPEKLVSFVHSSESGTWSWSDPASGPRRGAHFTWDTSALVDFIEPPLLRKKKNGEEIMTTEDGRLGNPFIASRLPCLWKNHQGA